MKLLFGFMFAFYPWNFIFFRIDNNTDMFCRLLLRSDPIIALKIGFQKKKLSELTGDMKKLLLLDRSDDDNEDDDDAQPLQASEAEYMESDDKMMDENAQYEENGGHVQMDESEAEEEDSEGF